jgi:tRNA(Ile)-lysidine synthase
VPALSADVLRVIRAHGLVAARDRVAVAVSGGADSVALLWLLHDLAADAELPGTLAGVIHVNHGLRGAEADRDEAFCRALAARLDLPFETTRADVAEKARAARRSLEATARDVRYAFFAEAAARLGATRVATAHTLDDQAETVLLRLLRGAGGRGLGGVRVKRGPFIRPLLTCRRGDVRRYLAARGESYCEDSSNASQSVPRNRVRHRLLPVIEDIAPRGIEALARFAQLAAADEAFLESLVSEEASSVVLSTENGVQLKRDALGHLPRAIARRMVRRALEQAQPAKAFSQRHVDAVLGLASDGAEGGHLDVPGLAVNLRGAEIVIKAVVGGPEGLPLRVPEFCVPLPVPGRVDLPEANVRVSASVYEGAPPLDGGMGGGDIAVLQASALALPLTIRSRRDGDRLRPFGAAGHRKLQDLLVDRKVPRASRDSVPIVVDARGRIVWVAGITIDEACRVTAPEAGVVILKLHR